MSGCLPERMYFYRRKYYFSPNRSGRCTVYQLWYVCGKLFRTGDFSCDEDCGDGMATVTIPYEFLPLPEKGTKGAALGRNGEKVCGAEVVNVKSTKAYDKTNLLTMRVPKEYAMKARFFKY